VTPQASAPRAPRRKPSLAERVADHMRRAILMRRYGPGERLVEDHLSSELGVSRVPIREALRVLAAEGLIDLKSGRGATVAAISETAALEMVEVRALLEGLNARHAAQRRDSDVLAELRSVLARGNSATANGTAEELARLNAEYHDLLAKAGRNGILGELMKSLRERTGIVFAPNNALRARKDWEEHSRILEAIVEGDGDLAALLAARHVHRAAAAALESETEQAAE